MSHPGWQRLCERLGWGRRTRIWPRRLGAACLQAAQEPWMPGKAQPRPHHESLAFGKRKPNLGSCCCPTELPDVRDRGHPAPKPPPVPCTALGSCLCGLRQGSLFLCSRRTGLPPAGTWCWAGKDQAGSPSPAPGACQQHLPARCGGNQPFGSGMQVEICIGPSLGGSSHLRQ